MPIYRLLQNMPMGPEEINRLTTAYEQALRTIGLVDRNDPIAEMIAKKIIEIGQTGCVILRIFRLRRSRSWEFSKAGRPLFVLKPLPSSFSRSQSNQADTVCQNVDSGYPSCR
jgi:hypothetical protein